MLMALSLLLQTRIFFVEVEGNTHLEDAQILEAAADCGIRFGATRRDIRSEEVKNRLLEQMPQLRWIGVNTYGCRAVISVRERNIREEISDAGGISSIAASCDGIITSCTVTQGTPMVSAGQAVRAGQILISGFTDCGITIRATRAQGDVFALTQRKISLSTPKISSQRQLTGEKTTRFSLTLGKKRINFYKGSGISPGSCVKMYARYVLTLPGGFQLPVALTKETVLSGQLEETSREISEDFFQTFADDYLQSQMVAGKILHADGELQSLPDRYAFTCTYSCEEMIGARRQEKIGDFNGKTDGADRKRGSGG